MSVSFNPAVDLDLALRAAAESLGLDMVIYGPDVRPADPRNGDFQANGALPYAKRQRENPRALAEKLVHALPAAILAAYTAEVAGPGFINFTLLPATLATWMQTYTDSPALAAGAKTAPADQVWVVDYSSPNTAKQMHVGHLRSPVIGEALCRLLAYSGAKVIRDNHIGDWGTQYGKLIWAYKRQLDAAALASDPLAEFERLYKVGNAASEQDEAVLIEAREELVKLQNGDEENTRIWQHINEVSLSAFQKIYDLFNIRFDLALGESFYNDKVAPVYEELTSTGLAEISQGALVVFHPEHKRFKSQPFIVRKSDGAANYASTDLATIRYRAEELGATGVLYVVDKRQGDHFEQLFLTARKWFTATNRPLPHLEHIDFGTVLGEDGKPLKTRSGENIKLKELISEAVQRAQALVDAKSQHIPAAERAAVAEVVGASSLQYADLCQNRSSDYVFAWDKLISLDGNTAAYLLYAVARIRSIFRKLDLIPGDVANEAGAALPSTGTELALARKLVQFSEALQAATQQLRPHFLCTYLYELAGTFSAFYSADKVAVDDPAIAASRRQLCARTLLVLETGLNLLGLRTLERM